MAHGGMHLAAVAGMALLALSSAAPAAETQAGAKVEAPHAVLRLVAETPGADDTFRGAILIDLDPGWKTYWINPGDAGIPPMLDFSASRNASATAVAFPAPQRFSDEFGNTNGYEGRVAVAITFRKGAAQADAQLRADLMLGVCKDICIPVSASLALDQRETGAAEQQRLVDDTFAALPRPSGPDGGIGEARLGKDGKTLEVEATLPDTSPHPQPQLFVAGPKGWFFGAPRHSERMGDRLTFTLPVLETPRKDTGAPIAIEAVLSDGARSFGARLEVERTH